MRSGWGWFGRQAGQPAPGRRCQRRLRRGFRDGRQIRAGRSTALRHPQRRDGAKRRDDVDYPRQHARARLFAAVRSRSDNERPWADYGLWKGSGRKTCHGHDGRLAAPRSSGAGRGPKQSERRDPAAGAPCRAWRSARTARGRQPRRPGAGAQPPPRTRSPRA